MSNEKVTVLVIGAVVISLILSIWHYSITEVKYLTTNNYEQVMLPGSSTAKWQKVK